MAKIFPATLGHKFCQCETTTRAIFQVFKGKVDTEGGFITGISVTK